MQLLDEIQQYLLGSGADDAAEVLGRPMGASARQKRPGEQGGLVGAAGRPRQGFVSMLLSGAATELKKPSLPLGMRPGDFVPGVSNLLAAGDTADAYVAGDKLGMGLGALGTVAGLPGAGLLRKSGAKAMQIAAGRGAKTADLAKADLAEKMLDGGAKNDAVFAATGWWRAPDGKMRFEIDDSKAEFTPGYEMAKTNSGQNGWSPLGGILKHDDLYAAYPDLALIPTSMQDLSPGVLGDFNPSQNLVRLSKGIGADDQLGKSVLLHELQHGVQDMEGFSKGGSADTVTNRLDNMRAMESYGLAKPARLFDDASERMGAASRADSYDKFGRYAQQSRLQPRLLKRSSYYDWREISDELGKMPRRPGPARDEWTQRAALKMRSKVEQNAKSGSDQSRFYDLIDRVRSDPRAIKREYAAASRDMGRYGEAAGAKSAIDRKYDRARAAGPFAQYQRLGGEAEARTVQERMNMTPDQRVAAPFFSTIPDDNAELCNLIGLGGKNGERIANRIKWPKKATK